MSEITILQGDCLEIMKTFDDNQFDLCLTDPPYGINYQSNMRAVSDKFSVLENDDNEMRLYTYPEMYRILQDNSVAIVFCSFKNYAEDYIELQKIFDIKNAIIWSKGGGGIGDLKHSLLTDYEIAIVAHRGQCEIVGKRLGSVWQFNKVDPNKMTHPTEKPVDLMSRLIRKYSKEGDTVLDPFLGSGTTAVACERMGRNCVGIEISPEYCEIARKRVQQEKDKMELFKEMIK